MTVSTIVRRTLVAATLLVPAFAMAQDNWPSKPVTIISPYNPGGTNDVVARTLATRLSVVLNQPFVVENRAGAAGVIGAQAVQRAAPDGYTLLAGNNGVMIVQAVLKDPAPFDPAKNFTALVKAADAAQFIGVSSELKVNTVAELIAVAKKRPGELNYSSSGVGSFGQFTTEYLKMLAGIDMLHVPGKGSAAALTELMSGRIHVLTDPLVLSQMQSPSIKVLATVNSSRFAGYPDIPTIKESGGPEIDITGWFGLLGPAGLPPAMVEKLAKASAAILAEPEVVATFVKAGLIAAPVTGDAFARLIASDMKAYTDIRNKAGIKAE
jgi:tripartite-type tricarboxylate transporter receptor subunit TctC